MNDLSAKRFVRALRGAEEYLADSAKCYCYSSKPEYQEVKEDLKFAIRSLESGEDFAGKLLFKNARNLSPKTARALAEHAKTPEERLFYLMIAYINAPPCAREDFPAVANALKELQVPRVAAEEQG